MKDVKVRSGIILFLCLSVAVFCYLLPNAQTSNECGVIRKLPVKIPGYNSIAVEPTAKEKQWLPESTITLKRRYFPTDVQPTPENIINVSLIISRGDKRSLHRPEVCMDGQGWSIPHKEVKTLTIGGKELQVMDLFLKRVQDGKEINAHYYFLWIGRSINTPSYARMQWLSLWDNFFKNLNHRWAYPGIFVTVDSTVKDPQADAWKRAQHIISHAVPVFHKDFGANEKDLEDGKNDTETFPAGSGNAEESQ